MTPDEIIQWNETVARGNPDEIDALQRLLIGNVHAKIMDEDSNYATAGWTATV